MSPCETLGLRCLLCGHNCICCLAPDLGFPGAYRVSGHEPHRLLSWNTLYSLPQFPHSLCPQSDGFVEYSSVRWFGKLDPIPLYSVLPICSHFCPPWTHAVVPAVHLTSPFVLLLFWGSGYDTCNTVSSLTEESSTHTHINTLYPILQVPHL